MKSTNQWIWLAVMVLIAVQAAQVVYVVHRESLTFDEGDHMFAGYMMGHTGDYGLNPEHPPLVKLLAAVPLRFQALWTPPLQGRFFKAEAYLSGRDWLAHNDGATQRLVFQMRMATLVLTIGLSLVVFWAAREWFGSTAALIALTVLTFDPNILAHGALVTTDMGISLFFLASIYAFYRYVNRPTLARLLLTGLAAGLLLATKHSGILLAPMLVVLAVWEVCTAKGERGRTALRLTGALAAIVVMGVTVLWAFYGFRYAARPAGLQLSNSLVSYAAQLPAFDAKVVLWFARWHLLPESYLMGLVDVKQVAASSPTFVFGTNYATGRWWYFPVCIAIKTTVGLLGLLGMTWYAVRKGRLRKTRELAYLLGPGAIYLAVAMASGMNIGTRHILPLYAMAAILAGAGVSTLAGRFPGFSDADERAPEATTETTAVPDAKLRKRWAWVAAVLVTAHIASALMVFPNYMAYANEVWGGPKNLHNLLSDANVDWAQQLIQVKEWRDRHPDEECWFAYFARPEIDPAVYGIHCHALPTADTSWMGGEEVIPAVIHGNVLISAGDLSGCEWPSARMNPYLDFQQLQPSEMIDYGVMVYHGDFSVPQVAAMSRGQHAEEMIAQGRAEQALYLTREATELDFDEIVSQTARGDAAVAIGAKNEARAAWKEAIASAQHMDSEAQKSYIPDLERKLQRLD